MNKLKDLRKQIDKVDEELLKFVGQRLQIVKEIGKYKRKNKVPVFDPIREQDKLNGLEKMGKKNNVDRRSIEMVWRTLFNISYEKE